MSNQVNRKSVKVIIGLSGGVDSSVAALRLLEQGCHVEAVFMKNWELDDEDGFCAAEQDLKDAQQVCDLLGIHLHRINFSNQYWHRVFNYFLHGYQAGRTPNPDVVCNKEIKFKAFLEYALSLGAEFIATGHYTNTACEHDQFFLVKAKDQLKDQTYFLHTLDQYQLSRSMFPIGNLLKSEVRRIAKENQLATHDKKDSTGICFIGERRFRDFLEQHIPRKPGEIVDTEDNVIGEHNGLMFYTIGQRQGIGIGGMSGADKTPWYVVEKNIRSNRIIVAQGHDHPELFNQALIAKDLSWINGPPAPVSKQLTAKIRYRQEEQKCTITEISNSYCRVEFEVKQRAITPGQCIVFYEGDYCLGGGVIEKAVSDHNNSPETSLKVCI